jgi:uncharacterized repeat protein (TIGR03803 family)
MKRNYAMCGLACALLLAVQPLALSQQLAARSPQTHFQILHSFQGGTDGLDPVAGMIRDADGNFYGTTLGGGNACAGGGCGTVFKIDKAGTVSVLYAFTGGTDGEYPSTSLVRDTDGILYGTASGGADKAGTVFKLDASGKFTLLYTFPGGAAGSGPSALILDSASNLYGTTSNGGDLRCGPSYAPGCGTVFKLGTDGRETVLYTFVGGSNGANPQASLVRDSAGNFYGTTFYGGNPTCYDGYQYGCGVVFRVDASGKETVLHRFNGSDGSNPCAGLLRDTMGTLDGTTFLGGSSRFGTLFKLTKTGTLILLHSFSGGADGANPYAGVIQDSAGNLYGVADEGGIGAGTVFRLDAAGKLAILHTFADNEGGSNPVAQLVRDRAGNLYGTTLLGGAGGDGTVFKIIH